MIYYDIRLRYGRWYIVTFADANRTERTGDYGPYEFPQEARRVAESQSGYVEIER